MFIPSRMRIVLGVLCLCTVIDDSSDVVGGGQVACQGHAKDLQRVVSCHE